MNLKDEMEYDIYGYLDKKEKPGKATKYSKEIARMMFDNLDNKWRDMSRIYIESLTDEIIREMGYEKTR